MITIEKIKINTIYPNNQEKITITKLKQAIHTEVNKILMIEIVETKNDTIDMQKIIDTFIEEMRNLRIINLTKITKIIMIKIDKKEIVTKITETLIKHILKMDLEITIEIHITKIEITLLQPMLTQKKEIHILLKDKITKETNRGIIIV